MRAFYRGSHWFWVISRIVIVLMFIISMVEIGSDGLLRGQDALLANGVSMVGTIVLATLAIIEIARGKKPGWLRIIGGVFMVLFGLALLVLFAIGPVTPGLRGLLLLLSMWFLLAGLRDFVVR